MNGVPKAIDKMLDHLAGASSHLPITVVTARALLQIAKESLAAPEPEPRRFGPALCPKCKQPLDHHKCPEPGAPPVAEKPRRMAANTSCPNGYGDACAHAHRHDYLPRIANETLITGCEAHGCLPDAPDFGAVQVGDEVVQIDSGKHMSVLFLTEKDRAVILVNGAIGWEWLSLLRTVNRPPLRVGDYIQLVRNWHGYRKDDGFRMKHYNLAYFQMAITEGAAIRVRCGGES